MGAARDAEAELSPLPTDERQPWPPLDDAGHKLYDEMERHLAWYSGDPEELRRVYGGSRASGIPFDSVSSERSLRTRIRDAMDRFWGRSGPDDPMSSGMLQLHVPLAGDICRTSADLLFASPPTFELEEADAGDRLFEIVEDAGIENSVIEMAEVAAATGGVYLRPVVDTDVADYPLLTIVSADQAYPEFMFGVLTAVTFCRELPTDDKKVMRHLERHERGGVILHGLYEGGPDRLGHKVELTAHDETKDIKLDNGDAIHNDGIDGLVVRYVPNMMPNRRNRGYQGRSDLQGIEPLMDALDETYTSWMRDIRLGVRRILVEQDYLEGIPSEGAWFNVDRAIYTPMDMGGAKEDPTAAIQPIDFDIRTEAHYDTAVAIREEAVTKAGYAAQTFNPRFEGVAESGTSRRMRERRSYQTMGKKERYIRGPVQDVLEIMLHLDRTRLGNSSTKVTRPRMEFSDAAGEGEHERAETLEVLNRARAASIETGVRMVHPDWEDDQVTAEVDKIKAEQGVSVPNLLPGDQG